MANTEAIIYLSDSRTHVETNKYRTFQSLKNPFHNLFAFHDETLSATAATDHRSTSLIIPLVGDIITTQQLAPGQVQILKNPTITNPYERELVNYLVVSFSNDPGETIADFELAANKLQQITANNFFIGKYDGRRHDTYKLSDTASGIFVFVIEGAFEVQNRLLHPRDGLALWNLTELEFEALSNEAMILLIEVY